MWFFRQLIGEASAHIALLDPRATLRPIPCSCANLDPARRLGNYSERHLGYGCGVSAVSTMLRLLARSLSSCGGQMLQAISSVPASERHLGYGCGVSAVSTMLRLLARSLSSCGGQMLQAISSV